MASITPAHIEESMCHYLLFVESMNRARLYLDNVFPLWPMQEWWIVHLIHLGGGIVMTRENPIPAMPLVRYCNWNRENPLTIAPIITTGDAASIGIV